MLKSIVCVFAGVLLLTGAVMADSPFDSGNWLVQGEVEYSLSGGDRYENPAGDQLWQVSFRPSLQRFVTSKLALGGVVSAAWVGQGNNQFAGLGVGPQATYFLGNPQSRTLPFVDAYMTYNFQLSNNDATAYYSYYVYDLPNASLAMDKGDDYEGLNFGFNIGMAHFVSRANALTFSAGFAYSPGDDNVRRVNASEYNRLISQGAVISASDYPVSQNGYTFYIRMGLASFMF